MRSYIKLFGPDLIKAKQRLQELCERDEFIEKNFVELPLQPANQEKKPKLTLEWDFGFDWSKDPNIEDVKDLIRKVDECLADTKAKYSISTVNDPKNPPRPEASLKLPQEVSMPFSVTYFKFYGPPIHDALETVEKIVQNNPDIIKSNLLSDDQHGVRLGIFDYALVWKDLPTTQAIEKLQTQVDNALRNIGIIYSMQTKYYSEEE